MKKLAIVFMVSIFLTTYCFAALETQIKFVNNTDSSFTVFPVNGDSYCVDNSNLVILKNVPPHGVGTTGIFNALPNPYRGGSFDGLQKFKIQNDEVSIVLDVSTAYYLPKYDNPYSFSMYEFTGDVVPKVLCYIDNIYHTTSNGEYAEGIAASSNALKITADKSKNLNIFTVIVN